MRNNWLRAGAGLAAALVVLAWMGPSTAQAAADEKGSVSGMVLTTDGKPAVGFALRLEQEIPMGMDRGGGGRKGKSSIGDSGAVGLQDEPRKNVKIVGRATTDKEGKFLISNVPVGGFLLIGGSKNIGWVYYPIEVIAGQETKLGEIKLVKT